MGLIIVFRIIIVLAVLFILLYVLLPDLFKKKTVREKNKNSSLEEIEQESIDLLNKKQEIRGVTEQTQKTINKIHKNLEK